MGAGISFLFLYILEAQSVLMQQTALGLRVHKDNGRRLATEPDTPREGWRKHGQVKQQPGSNSHLLPLLPFHDWYFVLACMRLSGSGQNLRAQVNTSGPLSRRLKIRTVSQTTTGYRLEIAPGVLETSRPR